MKNRVLNRIWQAALVLSAMIVPAAAQVLTASPSQLQFTVLQGSSTTPTPQTINITSDTATVVQSVSVTYAPGASGWLTVTPVFQATPVSTTVNITSFPQLQGAAAGLLSRTVFRQRSLLTASPSDSNGVPTVIGVASDM